MAESFDFGEKSEHFKEEDESSEEECGSSDDESETLERVVLGSLEEEFGNVEEQSEDSEDSENFGDTEEKPFQELSIQWLNMNKVKKRFREEVNTSENEFDSFKAIIQKIIDDFNGKKENEKWGRTYDLELTWDETDYFMRSYSCTYVSRPPIAKAIAKFQHVKVTPCYILFYFRKDFRVQIITASSGKAWLIARPFVDCTFPFKVAEKVADFDQIVWLERHHFVGERLKEAVMKPSRLELYKTSNLYYLIDHVVCKIKKESRLFKLCDEKDVSIKFTTSGLLRIHKKLYRRDYHSILHLFEEYLREDTKAVGGDDETKDRAFEFLYFLQPSRLFKEELDKSLAEAIFVQYQQGQKVLFHLQHKYLEDFLFASDIEVKIGSRFQSLEKTPPEIEDIITIINTEDQETFMEKFLGGKLRFTDRSSVKHTEAIIDCIEGELQYSNSETYFKMRKVWFEIRAEYLALLHDDFRNVLKKALIRDGKDGQLKHFWKKNDESKGKITPKMLEDNLNISEDKASELMSSLKTSMVQFVSTEKFITQKELIGEILKTPVIEKYRASIEQILRNPVNSLESNLQGLCNKDAGNVLEALEKERCVLKNTKQGTYAINPFPYPLKEMPNYDLLSQLLVELCRLHTEEEATYNEQPKNSRKKKDKTKGQVTVHVLQAKLNLAEDEASKLLSDLVEMKVSYVSTKYYVKQQELLGEILKIAAIEKYGDSIEEILRNPADCSDLKSKIGEVCKSSDARTILKALVKERCILKKTEHGAYVLNPFPYPLKGIPNYDLLSQLLLELYVPYIKEEETYNRLYLENIDENYLVFDQILPLKIEPCDILKYTDDTVYLYHVKARFGQPTREVCSQILNAATLIRNTLSIKQSKNYLQNLYEASVNRDTSGNSWFKEVKNEMLRLGKDEFINIFRSNRNIVFVYAYLPDPGKSFSHELEKSSLVTREMLGEENAGVNQLKLLGRLGCVDSAGSLTNDFFSQTKQDFEKRVKLEHNYSNKDIEKLYKTLIKTRPSSESTLAKMEVVRLAQNLASLGFDFKICEIPRKPRS